MRMLLRAYVGIDIPSGPGKGPELIKRGGSFFLKGENVSYKFGFGGPSSDAAMV